MTATCLPDPTGAGAKSVAEAKPFSRDRLPVLRGTFDPRYRDFVERSNREEYFEAHEVLEQLWLSTRDDKRDFYQELIQTAAALLKRQQGKPEAAARLAARAEHRLQKYHGTVEGLDVRVVISLLREVQGRQ